MALDGHKAPQGPADHAPGYAESEPPQRVPCSPLSFFQRSQAQPHRQPSLPVYRSARYHKDMQAPSQKPDIVWSLTGLIAHPRPHHRFVRTSPSIRYMCPPPVRMSESLPSQEPFNDSFGTPRCAAIKSEKKVISVLPRLLVTLWIMA